MTLQEVCYLSGNNFIVDYANASFFQRVVYLSFDLEVLFLLRIVIILTG